jgi:hypothetical protein
VRLSADVLTAPWCAATAQDYADMLSSKCSASKRYTRNKKDQCSFKLEHYAGPVTYKVRPARLHPVMYLKGRVHSAMYCNCVLQIKVGLQLCTLSLQAFCAGAFSIILL